MEALRLPMGVVAAACMAQTVQQVPLVVVVAITVSWVGQQHKAVWAVQVRPVPIPVAAVVVPAARARRVRLPMLGMVGLV